MDERPRYQSPSRPLRQDPSSDSVRQKRWLAHAGHTGELTTKSPHFRIERGRKD